MHALLTACGTLGPKMYSHFWAFHRWLVESSRGASSLRAETKVANISASNQLLLLTVYLSISTRHVTTQAQGRCRRLKGLTNIQWVVCTLLIVFKVLLCVHVISKLNSYHQRSSVCRQLWTLPPKSMCVLSIFKLLTTNWLIVLLYSVISDKNHPGMIG